MDALSTALVTAAPQLGIGGILLGLLVYVLRNASSDRGDYRKALDDTAARHATELVRINTAHDAELAEMRADIAELRLRVDQLNTVLDHERELRRQAEDKAAEVLRQQFGGAS